MVLPAALLGAATVPARPAAAQSPLAPPHPTVRSAAEADYPPFSFVDTQGRADGFSVELLQATLAAMDREASFRTGSWPEVRQWLERGEVQALPLVGRTPERERLFDFTFPYMTLHGAIVVRRDTTDVETLADLRGRLVAVMQGDNAEEFLRREPRDFSIRTVPSFHEALRDLAAGRADAVVVQRLVALRLIAELGLEGLTVVNRPIDGFRQDFCFAVKEGDRDTLALLNEGLALVIADGTYRRLHAKWFAALQLPSGRRLVIGGDRNFPPFEFLDEDGHPAGFNVDLTRAIAREVGLDLEIRLGRWTDLRAALERADIDALQGMFYSLERERRFDFTPPHTTVHCVAVVRAGTGPPPGTLAELAGRRLAVERGDIMHDLAVENGLKAQVTALPSQEDALLAVAEGRADCALVARVTALYWIERHAWNSLVVGRQALLSPDYGYAVPDGHRALLAELSEGLQVIEQSGEYKEIYDRWIGVYQPETRTLATALRYSAMVVAPLLLALLLFFLWSWSLRRQVATRTAELAESELRFRRTLEEAPFPIMLHAEDGEVLALSRAWLDLTGYGADELPSVAAWTARAYPGREEEVGRAIARTYTFTSRERDGEFEVLCADGDRRSWDFSSTPLGLLPDGRRAVISMAADVTERRRSERLLAEREGQARLTGRLARLGGWSVDLAARRLAWSEEVAAIHERPAEPAPTVAEAVAFFAPEDRERIARAFAACAGHGDPFDEEAQLVTASGRTLWVRTMGVAERDEAGAIVRVRGALQDITERRALEHQLLQAQKMEAVGRLAGGVAHDYNNMLNVIIGHAELALGELQPGDRLREDLEEILAAARRSADITRQLLAFARRQTIAPKVLDLNRTVGGMLKMLARLIGEDIELAWRPGGDLWPVRMDPSQLDQILANLCVNARDAIAGVGTITIETANVSLGRALSAEHPDFAAGEFVLLAVSDTGAGMDRTTLANIFEPFFTTKSGGRGTGLGLATVFGIVKQNEGFINVYSEPGRGTTVKIYLRRHHDAVVEAAAPAAASALPAARGETVLLVEDEPAILRLATRVLTTLGYTTLAAATPAEAERLAGAHHGPIDLLVTDVVMPEMDGRTLAGRLAAARAGLRVLYMSGYTANVIAHHGVLDEGVDFIQKPFSVEELAATIRRVLDA